MESWNPFKFNCINIVFCSCGFGISCLFEQHPKISFSCWNVFIVVMITVNLRSHENNFWTFTQIYFYLKQLLFRFWINRNRISKNKEDVMNMMTGYVWKYIKVGNKISRFRYSLRHLSWGLKIIVYLCQIRIIM